jgi:CheY-like chemotaxis protein
MFDTHVPTHRVLIVDDEFVPRSIESFALEGTGRYYAVEAGNGADALALLEDDHYDCAVIDLSMPDMSGIELITVIRRQFVHRNLPIVLVLPEHRQGDPATPPFPGPTHVISKPFQPWDLARLLDSLTGDIEGSEHILSVEAVLRGFPYPTMILDAHHHVLLANGAYYDATQTGVGDCYVFCNEKMHADGEVPPTCPLDRCAESGESADETIETISGLMRVSVYPLAIETGAGERLYLHVTQPVDC